MKRLDAWRWTKTAAWLGAFLALTACEMPAVSSSSLSAAGSHIDGRVVVQGHARGNVLVFLFDANDPPPPEGTGRPISFAVVPGTTVFGPSANDPSGTGPFVAPFSLSLVPAGHYLLQGFVDHDGCVPSSAGCHGPDFVPWYDVMDEPNRGDVGGAALDPSTSAQEIFTIDAAHPSPVEDAVVTFGEVATFPLDRPSFRIEGEASFDPSNGEKRLTLDPEPIDAQGVYESNAAFLVQALDEDGDTQADTLFPKVWVQKLTDGKPDAVLLEASLVPPAALVDGTGNLVVGTTQVASLTVKIDPVALDVSDPSTPKPLPSVPSGAYEIILVSGTGQTWRLPNELAPSSAPALGLPAVESQGFTLQVP